MELSSKKIFMFQDKILSRYKLNKRELPWRDTFNPYWVLVSEVMSQQTQVERVVPKFLLFIKKLPNLESLAACDKVTLFGLRSGLGFNSRALRLQKSAKIIYEEYGGIVPSSREQLLELPGIGPYTSASICSFAFNLSEPVIDTNIRRVYLYELGLDNTLSNNDIEDIAIKCIPKGQSNDRHNALMDYGSLVATAKSTGIKPLSKQSKFKGSDRQVRGWILKYLLQHTSTTYEIISREFPEKEIKSIVRGMILDGLITLSNGEIYIES